MNLPFTRIFVCYGSESGNAERLARQICELNFLRDFPIKLSSLNTCQLSQIEEKDLLLIVTSTFGDGEAPGNADAFTTMLEQQQNLSTFHYGVFALGDVAYPKFCQFGKDLDTSLAQKGAIKLINRVDADIHYQEFFQLWCDALSSCLAGNFAVGKNLQLKIKAYSEHTPHPGKILRVERLNTSESGVFHIEIDISGSGMSYRAGDLLYVIPENNRELLEGLAAWLRQPSAINALSGKELRRAGKPLLRLLAKQPGNDELKKKLKIKYKAELESYLYGRDLLDLLQSHAEPASFTLEDLLSVLPDMSPRAYSIASSDFLDNKLNLCVRDVSYPLSQRQRHGTASHALAIASPGDEVKVFVRANPDFNLPAELNSPLILIGAGTGIAPYIGFLQQLESISKPPKCVLFFGERYQEKDYLYKTQLQEWQDKNVLTELFTAFSREQEAKRYVQHLLLEQAYLISNLLSQGAMIYLCGSKANLDKAIDKSLLQIFQNEAGLSEEQAQDYLRDLTDSGRFRKDLY